MGNTPTVCRKSYIHPAIVSAYLDGVLVAQTAMKIWGCEGLRPEEAGTLALLRAPSALSVFQELIHADQERRQHDHSLYRGASHLLPERESVFVRRALVTVREERSPDPIRAAPAQSAHTGKDSLLHSSPPRKRWIRRKHLRPARFVAFPAHLVLVRLQFGEDVEHLGEHVRHGPQFRLSRSDASEQGGFQTYTPASRSGRSRSPPEGTRNECAKLVKPLNISTLALALRADRPPRMTLATLTAKGYRNVSAPLRPGCGAESG